MIHKTHHAFGFVLILGLLGVIMLIGSESTEGSLQASLNFGKTFGNYSENIATPDERLNLETTRDDFVNFFQAYQAQRDDLLTRIYQSSRNERSQAQELEATYQVLHFEGVDPSLAQTLEYTGKVCLNQRKNIKCD